MEILNSDKTQKQSRKTKSKFTQEEDSLLVGLIQQFEIFNWHSISHHMKTKNARQCQERWNSYLKPSINANEWTLEEDELLLNKYEEVGAKWVKISKNFSNKTDVQCKNRFLTLQRRLNRYTQLISEIENVPSFQLLKDHQKENQNVLGILETTSLISQMENQEENTDFFQNDFF
jgi:hypothetical protein